MSTFKAEYFVHCTTIAKLRVSRDDMYARHENYYLVPGIKIVTPVELFSSTRTVKRIYPSKKTGHVGL